ncbi:MAG: glycerophosphodiester phosphodiesterase family protein [Phycisphaerae bacterium]
MLRDSRPAGPGVCALLVALLPAAGTRAEANPSPAPVPGYINHIPPEPDRDREARHARVAERRRGTPVIVHRGANEIAPENTLEAYAAAMDCGADGIEIDIRRSADGVLYLFHDDTLDRMTDGTGKVGGLRYYELLAHRFRRIFGPAGEDTRIPTLAAVLVLARQRAALLHLDVKEPGLEDDIQKMFDAADVWDHVVEINTYNTERLRRHPKVTLMPYKGWFPQGADATNAEVVKAFLARPGRMIICEDPRAAVRALNRKPGGAVPLPEGLRVEWSAPADVATSPTTHSTTRRTR